jgi:CRP-like cAMP-binding protein
MDFIELFRGASKILRISRGQALFREGEVGATMFVVLAGSADVMVGKTVVGIIRPGSIVGEMALVDDERRSATVITRTPCEVVALSKSDFDRLLSERPDFARYVLKLVVDRLRRTNQDLVAAQAANNPAGAAPSEGG